MWLLCGKDALEKSELDRITLDKRTESALKLFSEDPSRLVTSATCYKVKLSRALPRSLEQKAILAS